MKKLAMVVLTALFVSCGPPSPMAQCKETSTLQCKRVYECYDSATRASSPFIATYGATETECVSKLNSSSCTFSESNPCSDSSKKWDAVKANNCLDDIRKTSCETVTLGTFSSGNCSGVCG
jgi:hypothetical protein